MERRGFSRFPEQIRTFYGTKTGFFLHCWSSLLEKAGAYESVKQLDVSHTSRYVFVCKGNICRSPFAERCASALGIASGSFGLVTSAGHEPDPVAVRAASEFKVDMSTHRARPIGEYRAQEGDVLIAFEPPHLNTLKRDFKDTPCTLLGLWATPHRPHIQDPFGLSEDYFRTCFSTIDAAVKTLRVLTKR